MELLASHRKKKQGRFYQKVGGRGKKSRWQVTQGTLSNFFSIIGLLKKCICGTTNFFSPNCYPDQEENSGKSFKNTGQSRQLIIRPSLLSTQCLKKYFQPLWIWLPSGLVGCSTDWKPLLENSCSICSCRRTSACHFQTPFETNCKEKRLCKMMIKKEVLSFFFISIISLGTDILFT